jgi:hypothetical protein
MSKSATLDSRSDSDTSRSKRSRRPRAQQPGRADSVALAANRVLPESSAFPVKPLLVGVGIGAALALTAVALGSRPAKSAYFGSSPTVASAFAKTAALLVARIVARKALSAAANQGARKLASAWPL